MSATLIADLQDQAKKFWSPIFQTKLKEDTILPSLVSKDYEGSIENEGDTVYVSQIERPTAQRKTVGGPDYDKYSSSKLQTSRVSVSADTVIEAGIELGSLAQLQSQIGSKDSEIRQRMFEALEIELNNYLYEKVSPSTSAPDMVDSGVSDFNATQLGTQRIKASQQKWPKMNRYLLLDPQFYQDLLNASTLTSNDYAPDNPVVGGQFVLQRMGWNILEDNSDGMKNVSPTLATSDLALGFNPDFLIFVMQKSVTFKISDLHAQKRRGILLTAEMLVGSELGNDGDVKHLTVYNS